MSSNFSASGGQQHLKAKKKFDIRRNFGRNIFIFIGLLPAVLWMFYFVAYPMGMAFFKSFFTWDLSSNTDSFLGLENFQRMLTDKVFLISLVNTIMAVIYVVPATIILSLLIASLLNAVSIRVREVFTPAYFLPVITSTVAVSIVWKWLYHPSFGLINYLFETVGLPIQKFLTSPVQALPSIAIVAIWGSIGYYAVILLAALKGIPNVYYEAATIDGAKGLKMFRYITVPLLKPTILFTSIMAITGTFQIFVPIQIMTRGGPGNSTYVLALYIFNTGVTHLEMGYASAIAMILFAIIMIITVIQWKFIRSDWEY